MVDLKGKLNPSHPLKGSIKPGDSTASPSTPAKPEESKEVIFHCSAPAMRFSYPAKDEYYDRRAAFSNHFLITENEDIISHLRKEFVGNAKSYFTVTEVDQAFLNKQTTLPAVKVVIEPLPGTEGGTDTKGQETTQQLPPKDE
jgi:hypothetical protein